MAQAADKIRDVALPEPSEGPYRIQVGDVLEVSFFKTVELNRTRTVGPDGQISLMLIGQLKVAGRTIDDLTDELTERYAHELTDPQVTLSVQEFAGMKIYVGGEVNRPGMLPFRGGLTLVQAIMDAGGFMKTARLSEVVVIRRGDEGQPVGTVVNVQAILKEAEFGDDVALAPSDVIFVARSRVANVNLFIEQYFRNMYPIPIFLGFNIWQ
jgi:protein involved in polysaccharide export with SLBB domain